MTREQLDEEMEKVRRYYGRKLPERTPQEKAADLKKISDFFKDMRRRGIKPSGWRE